MKTEYETDRDGRPEVAHPWDTPCDRCSGDRGFLWPVLVNPNGQGYKRLCPSCFETTTTSLRRLFLAHAVGLEATAAAIPLHARGQSKEALALLEVLPARVKATRAEAAKYRQLADEIFDLMPRPKLSPEAADYVLRRLASPAMGMRLEPPLLGIFEVPEEPGPDPASPDMTGGRKR